MPMESEGTPTPGPREKRGNRGPGALTPNNEKTQTKKVKTEMNSFTIRSHR